MNKTITVLAVDDEEDLLDSFAELFSSEFKITTTCSVTSALELFDHGDYSVVMLDVQMPKMDGFEMLKAFKQINPSCEVIMMTVLNDASLAIKALNLGAFSYLTKPLNYETTVHTIQQANAKRRLTIRDQYNQQTAQDLARPLIAVSAQMKMVLDMTKRCGAQNITVLLTGETGTGKEIVARNIHAYSKRNREPFVVINCAAIPRDLIESELFGSEKGAYTGSSERKIGKIEYADKGVLFFDEIAFMPIELQTRLLRFLQERQFQRIGGNQDISVDVQIIAATNRNLKEIIATGAFLPDLYYRLNVADINIAPLRERKADIPVLAQHFINIFNREYGKQYLGIKPDALQLLINYSWPGNVRELENCLRKIIALQNSKEIVIDDLPRDLMPVTPFEQPNTDFTGGSLVEYLSKQEKQIITKVLLECDGNRAEAARQLQIPRTTLISRIEQFGIG